jgi:hypothetical protein
MLKIVGTMFSVVLIVLVLVLLLVPVFTIHYIHGLKEKEECRQVQPVLRDFVYYFNWITLFYTIFRVVMWGFLIHSIGSYLQSGGGVFGKFEPTGFLLVNIILYASTIKYLYSIGNHPYCRLFETKTRNFLFVVNWVCLILSATSLFGVSL